MTDDTNPQISQILSRIQLLTSTYSALTQQQHSIALKTQKLLSSNTLIQSQIQVQNKKTKALFLLSSELQRKHDASLFLPTLFQRNSTTIANEKILLKELLIKQGEEIELYRELNHFLKEFTLNNNKEVLNGFVNQQSEVLAKAESKLLELKNSGLSCRRRWSSLEEENGELGNRVKTLKQQLQRQQANIKDRYQEYLNKINKYNTKLVYLNNCQDQRIISEHLIEQMSLVQKQRKTIQDEYSSLKQTHKEMTDSYEKAKQNKKVLLDFFSPQNQQTKLCNSMRLRIRELTDLTHDLKLYSSHPKLLLVGSVAESIKDMHKRMKDKLEFLKGRFEESLEGKASIEEVEVANFFNGLFGEKDEKMNWRARLNEQLREKVEDLMNTKSVLEQKCRKIKQAIQGDLVLRSNSNPLQRDLYSMQKPKIFTFNNSEID